METTSNQHRLRPHIIPAVLGAFFSMQAILGATNEQPLRSVHTELPSSAYAPLLPVELMTTLEKSILENDIRQRRQIPMHGQGVGNPELRDKTPDGYQAANVLVAAQKNGQIQSVWSAGIIEIDDRLFFVSISHAYGWVFNDNSQKPDNMYVHIPNVGSFSTPEMINQSTAVDLVPDYVTNVPYGAFRGDPIILSELDPELAILLRIHGIKPLTLSNSPPTHNQELQAVNPITGTIMTLRYAYLEDNAHTTKDGTRMDGQLCFDDIQGTSAALVDTRLISGFSGLPLFRIHSQHLELVAVHANAVNDDDRASTVITCAEGL